MEQGDRELRFICKLCDKRYPCGKSLGGHMRSHVIANSPESEQKFEHLMRWASKRESGVDLGGTSGYGLRENPKKTWRAVDSSFPLPQEKVCKQCGKGFQSLKALCGHMACHSDKERVLKDDHSWTSENSYSDTEVEDMRRQTRFKNKRIVVKSSPALVNGSSSVSEVDEQEQEEVAICLMMLSRDSGNRSVVESSDNNSVVLETKSSSINMGIRQKEGSNCETMNIKKLKLKSSVVDAESVQFENSYSGYFRNGSKKVESDISVDEILRNGKYNKPKDVFDAELVKRSKYECLNCNKTFTSPQGLGGHRPCNKKPNQSLASRHEIGENSAEGDDKKRKAKDSGGNAEKRIRPKKSKGHECPICFKMFKSGQALGGHKRSHFIGGSEDRINKAPVSNQQVLGTTDLIDLNLPAPEEDEVNEFSQFI